MLSQAGAEHGPVEASEHDGASAPRSTVGIALDYLAQGSSSVPQLPGGKHPCRRWKLYQTCHPTPGVATLAKLTPWHPKRKLRGNRSSRILPPSLPASGRR
jgi:hypothetical protein